MLRTLLRFLVWTALLVGAVVGVARATAIRWWRIPEQDAFLTASLEPSLRAGDWIILWRATPPRFGDLVVCPEPGAPGRVAIGRVIGEPGDRIEISGDDVLVNDRRSRSEFACADFDVADPNTLETVTQKCDIEDLNGRRHLRGVAADQRVIPSPVKAVVEPGRVFLLSDNRLYPYDSRDFGTVEGSTCREQVLLRLMGQEGLGHAPSRFTWIR